MCVYVCVCVYIHYRMQWTRSYSCGELLTLDNNNDNDGIIIFPQGIIYTKPQSRFHMIISVLTFNLLQAYYYYYEEQDRGDHPNSKNCNHVKQDGGSHCVQMYIYYTYVGFIIEILAGGTRGGDGAAITATHNIIVIIIISRPCHFRLVHILSTTDGLLLPLIRWSLYAR